MLVHLWLYRMSSDACNAVLARCEGENMKALSPTVIAYFTDKQRSGGGALATSKLSTGCGFTSDPAELILNFKTAKGKQQTRSYELRLQAP